MKTLTLLFLILAGIATADSHTTGTLQAATTGSVVLLDVAGRPYAYLCPFSDHSRGFRVLALDGEQVLGVWIPQMAAPQVFDYRRGRVVARQQRAAAAKAETERRAQAARDAIVYISPSGTIHKSSCRYFKASKAINRKTAKLPAKAKECGVCFK